MSLTIPMSFVTIFILALIQSVTEFIPVSSSAHLLVAEHFLPSLHTSSTAFNLAVHAGSLFAAILFFRTDTLKLIQDIPTLFYKKSTVRYLAISSIPLALAGITLFSLYDRYSDSLMIIGISSIVFGILLAFVDRKNTTDKTLNTLHGKSALYIGFMQVLALVPGASRSGLTYTALRSLSINRQDCVLFTTLTGMVEIGGAIVVGGIKYHHELMLSSSLLLGVILSFIFSYTTLKLFFRGISQNLIFTFSIYRVIFGTIIVILMFSMPRW